MGKTENNKDDNSMVTALENLNSLYTRCYGDHGNFQALLYYWHTVVNTQSSIEF